MNIVENQKFDKEIALYGSSELLIKIVHLTDRQMDYRNLTEDYLN